MATAVVLVLTAAGVVAAQSGSPDDPEPVRVYTNDDLEKYAAYAGDDDAAGPPEQDWTAVQEFLDREYGRIDADRHWDLARAREDRDEWRDRDRRDLWRRHPVHFLGVNPFFPRFGVPRHHRPRAEKVLPHGNGRGVHGPGHGRFTHLRGEDAVPGPRPNRPHNGADVGPRPAKPRHPKTRKPKSR